MLDRPVELGDGLFSLFRQVEVRLNLVRILGQIFLSHSFNSTPRCKMGQQLKNALTRGFVVLGHASIRGNLWDIPNCVHRLEAVHVTVAVQRNDS